MELKKLDETFSVTPQVTPESIKQAAELGFAIVVNARPDGEEEGQPFSEELAAAARENNIAYVHIPVLPGKVDAEHVAAFADALDTVSGPALGFCRTGTRALHMWAMASVGRLSVADIIEKAAAAGYDLSDLEGRLQELASAR